MSAILHLSTNFNPRSREGSDLTWQRGNSCFPNFNPRSREGSDLDLGDLGNKLIISIHAPARGATRIQTKDDSNPGISIHAPARGATSTGLSVEIRQAFQSTLPRGERRQSTWSILPAVHFNPRSREGSDQ